MITPIFKFAGAVPSMSDSSSYSLASSMSQAVAFPADLNRSLDVVGRIVSGQSAMDPDKDAPSTFELAVETAAAKVRFPSDGPAFLNSVKMLAAVDRERGLADDMALMASRHVLSLTRIQKSEHGNGSISLMDELSKSHNLPESSRAPSAMLMVNAYGISDKELSSMERAIHPDRSPWVSRSFVAPTNEDRDCAADISGTLEGGNVSLLSGIYAEASSALRKFASAGGYPDQAVDSLSRIFADNRIYGEYEPAGAMAMRMASDISASERAKAILGDDPEKSENFVLIHDASRDNATMRSDLEAEALGQFHKLSRGASGDLRSDMMTGANLSPEILQRMTKDKPVSVIVTEQASGQVVEDEKDLSLGLRDKKMNAAAMSAQQALKGIGG